MRKVVDIVLVPVEHRCAAVHFRESSRRDVHRIAWNATEAYDLFHHRIRAEVASALKHQRAKTTEGAALLNAVQDVYLCKEVTVA